MWLKNAGPNDTGQVGNALGSSLDPLRLNTQFGLRLVVIQEDQDGDTVERRRHNKRQGPQRKAARHGNKNTTGGALRPIRENARHGTLGRLRGRPALDRKRLVNRKSSALLPAGDNEGMGTLP